MSLHLKPVIKEKKGCEDMQLQAILKSLIHKSQAVVFLTGAGISVPSGIPDFRSADGLYQDQNESLSPEEILSHRFFILHPDQFYQFYKSKMLYLDCEPNIAHRTIAKLKQVQAVITQNIDGLHQKAGSTNVIELHGSVERNYCMKCGQFYPVSKIVVETGVPRCDCGGIIKPDVVLYEELLPEQALNEAIKQIKKADLLIVVGTSLLVNPAASLLHYFSGSNLVIINSSATPYDRYANLVIREPLETILTEELL